MIADARAPHIACPSATIVKLHWLNLQKTWELVTLQVLTFSEDT